MENRKVLFTIVLALAAIGVVIARNDLIVGSIRVDSVLLFR